jgi:general stress protein YciG
VARYLCISCATELLEGIFPNGPANPCAICVAEGRPPIVTGPMRVPEPVPEPPAKRPMGRPRKDGTPAGSPRPLMPDNPRPLPKRLREEPIAAATDGAKVCSKCEQEKPLEAFNKNHRSRDGINFWCRDCQKAANARRYQEKKEANPSEPLPRRGGFQKGDQRTREWGRKGGRKTVDRHGSDHMRDAGKAGGTALKDARGPEFFREIGRMGGGRAGGQATLERHGVEHFSAAAKKRHEPQVVAEVIDAAPPSAPAPAADPNAMPSWLVRPMTLAGCAGTVGVPLSRLVKAVEAGALAGVCRNGIWITDASLWAEYRDAQGLGKKKGKKS